MSDYEINVSVPDYEVTVDVPDYELAFGLVGTPGPPGPDGPPGPVGPPGLDQVITFPTGSEPNLVDVPDGTLLIEYQP